MNTEERTLEDSISSNECRKTADTLMNAFPWRLSNEGKEYWSGVYTKLIALAELGEQNDAHSSRDKERPQV